MSINGLFPALQSPPDLALIPAGSFGMGVLGKLDRYVSAFYMAKCQVTKALWDEVWAWGYDHGYGFSQAWRTTESSAWGTGPNHPVHMVSWYDVIKWCNAMSRMMNLTPCYSRPNREYKTGWDEPVVCNWNADGYRLPTEAEWEKAARGGLTGKCFPWGIGITQKQANYKSLDDLFDDSRGNGAHPDWGKQNFAVRGYPTSPVGSFAENGYGLYDMAGNVNDWCWDWYGNQISESKVDPRGPVSGSDRVCRGGGWDESAAHCQVWHRGHQSPSYPECSIGFRVARSSV